MSPAPAGPRTSRCSRWTASWMRKPENGQHSAPVCHPYLGAGLLVRVRIAAHRAGWLVLLVPAAGCRVCPRSPPRELVAAMRPRLVEIIDCDPAVGFEVEPDFRAVAGETTSPFKVRGALVTDLFADAATRTGSASSAPRSTPTCAAAGAATSSPIWTPWTSGSSPHSAQAGSPTSACRSRHGRGHPAQAARTGTPPASARRTPPSAKVRRTAARDDPGAVHDGGCPQ